MQLRRTLKAAALAATCALAACGTDSTRQPSDDGSQQEPTTPAVEPALGIAASLADATAGEFRDSYGLYDVRTLHAALRMPASNDVVVVRMEVMGPTSQSLSTRWAAFSADPSAPASIPHPIDDTQNLPVDKLDTSEGAMTGVLPIFIAGTNITRYRMTGLFPVEVYLDDAQDPPLAQASFELSMPEL